MLEPCSIANAVNLPSFNIGYSLFELIVSLFMLSTIQIEEKAIEELLARYRATAKSYETVSVQRVSIRAAQPLWATHKSN